MRTQLFGLTDYSRVLFIDRNSLVINNPDHLFETPVPSDHPLEDSRLVFTALRQTECLFFEPCSERRDPSPRFWLLIPDVISIHS